MLSELLILISLLGKSDRKVPCSTSAEERESTVVRIFSLKANVNKGRRNFFTLPVCNGLLFASFQIHNPIPTED